MFKNTPSPHRFCNKKGFSLVELIVVILIIAILAVAVFAGGSAAIKKANIAKATSDLHNFQIAMEMTLNETPGVANIATETNREKLSGIMDLLNGNLAADYNLTLQIAEKTGNISMNEQADESVSFIFCQSDKTDPWGNPYFVIFDRAERGGSSASEFYMTAVSAGPNAILHLDGAIDVDDIFLLTSYVDGDVISATYNMTETAPTIVGGSEAATSYTDPAASPVNNGVTTGVSGSGSGSDPAPVSNPFASATVGDIVSAGTMYANGTAIVMPSNPVYNGDLYSWATSNQANNVKDYYNATITFGDTVSGKELNWVKVSDTLFICDRNLWNFISWDDINGMDYMTGKTVTIDGQTFTLRCLTSDEWDTYVSSHTTNGDPFYWQDGATWTQTEDGSSRKLRGLYSASESLSTGPSARNVYYGFRPALELVG